MLYDDMYVFYCEKFNTEKVFIFDYLDGSGNIVVASEDKITSKLPLNNLEERYFKKLVKSINEYDLLTGYGEFAVTCSMINFEKCTMLFHITNGLRCTYCFDFKTGDIIG